MSCSNIVFNITTPAAINFDLTSSAINFDLAQGLASAASLAKLDSIEAGADVTRAENVKAAGATMNSDESLANNNYFLDEDDFISNSATKIASQQSIKAYVDAHSGGSSSSVIVPISRAVSDGSDTAIILTGIDTTYNNYLIRWSNVRQYARNGSPLIMKVLSNSVPITSNYRGVLATMEYTDTTFSLINPSYFGLAGRCYAHNDFSGASGEGILNISQNNPSFYGHGFSASVNSGDVGYSCYGGSIFNVQNAINGIQIQEIYGEPLLSGTVELFGLKEMA